jgi:hypothetical protein
MNDDLGHMTQFLETSDGGSIHIDDIKKITSKGGYPFAILADGDSRRLANVVLEKVFAPRARAAIAAEEARADEFIRRLTEGCRNVGRVP